MIQKTTATYGVKPYAAVCRFRRQTGRPDKGNYLESGEVRGNMLSSTFPGFYLSFGEKSVYQGLIRYIFIIIFLKK